MTCRVMYHLGESIGLKTKAVVGRLSFESGRLFIKGATEVEIPFAELHSVELFRLHGAGRMLKVVHTNGTLFVSVIRFCLFGYFAVTNFYATGRLRDELYAEIGARGANLSR